MKALVRAVVITGALLFLGSATSSLAAQRSLVGNLGSSGQWHCGWMDLSPPADFSRGDTLRLQIGGDAQRIVVRLLPKGSKPDSDAGIVERSVAVPANRIVDVVLKDARKKIIQISVHGGPKPWDKYDLGKGNGDATLESVVVNPEKP